jgi:hypothetical protein
MGVEICIYGMKKFYENQNNQFTKIYDFNMSYTSLSAIEDEMIKNATCAFERELCDVLNDLWRNPLAEDFSLNSSNYCCLSRVKNIFDKYDIYYCELSEEFKVKFYLILDLFLYDSDEYSDIFMFA